VSGLATLADALNAKIHACLVVPSREAAMRMHLVEKLAKIGVIVTKEIEPNRIELSSLNKVDCVIMVEASGNKAERDNVLAVAVKCGKPAFLINVKASHPSWDRVADYAKRKGIANVIPITGFGETKPEGGPIPDHIVKAAKEIGVTVAEDEISEMKRGQISVEDYVRELERATKENGDAIAALRADVQAAQAETVKIAKELSDANLAAQTYANERDCYAREKEEALAKLHALEAENAKLRTAEGKRAGGHAGQAERWKREFKKQAEDEKARADKLEAEVTALRAKKTPAVREEQVRMLLSALEAKALSLDLTVSSVLRLAKGE